MTKRFSFSALIAMLTQMATPVLLTLGIVLCLTSAYGLPFETKYIILFTLATAIPLSLLFLIPNRRSLFVLLFVLVVTVAGCIFLDQLKAGVYSVLTALDEQLEISISGVIFKDFTPSLELLKTGPMALQGIICFMLTLYFSLCCGLLKAPMLSYVLALPLAVLCVLYVDNPPDLSHVILLVTAILLVPMQQLSCQSESNRIAVVNLMLIILVAGFALNMRYISTKIDGGWLSTNVFEEHFVIVDEGGISKAVKFEKPQTKPISDAGQEKPQNVTVMTVTSSATGTTYLRGYSLAHYVGDSWEQPSESFGDGESAAALFSAQAAQYSFPGLKKQEMTIVYASPSTLVHIPYFCIPGGGVVISEDGVTLPTLISSYTLDYWQPNRVRAGLMELPESMKETEQAYRSYVYQNYTATLPEFYDYAISEIGISDLSDREAVVMAVTSYLTTHNSYSRTVSETPQGEDVGLYFLTVTHTGNCIHYSTSAVAILQSLGIPTRFVGGYRTTITQANVAKEVTDLEAHAWIEVYFDGVGWLPFEATFAGNGLLRTPDPTVTPIPTPAPENAQQPFSPTPSIVPKNTPSASTNSQDPEPDEPKNEGLPTALWLIIGLCSLIILTVLRRVLKQKIRFYRWAKMSNNRYAISAYRYSRRLAAHGPASPEIVIELANKAKFSQHTLTAEERRLVERAITKQCADVRALSKFKQFFLAYIVAYF